MQASIRRRLPVAVLAVSALVLVCCAMRGWGGDGLLSLLPTLLLGSLLLLRRYPGERLLIARRVGAAARWPRARSAVSRRPRALATVARGGLLIARSLAVRPPPALSPAS